MYAHAGDQLITDGDPPRRCTIIAVLHDDGSPPYVVKWLADGHIAMVSPDQFARVIPAEPQPDRTVTPPAQDVPTDRS
jgi:Domain of unknown function (DUF1918)